jgi:adenosylcobinamide hydrolase
MRYYLRNGTLIIRGCFRAASTGIDGGIKDVSTLLNHSVPPTWDHRDPARDLGTVIARYGLPTDFFGLLTAVEMRNLCIFQIDFITVFITAGIRNHEPSGPGTINIIICSREGMGDAALLGAVITATEAKVLSLQENGYEIAGTPTDAVIVASEGEAVHQYAGPVTEVGKRVREAVAFGVVAAMKRHEGAVTRDAPSYFIYSRYGGDHWLEWEPNNCPYYPCHFAGQRCDFCYCPFYPCGDESLGHWVESSTMNGLVWNCASCTLLHEPEIAEYLLRNPEAPLRELKALKNRMDAEGSSPS